MGAFYEELNFIVLGIYQRDKEKQGSSLAAILV